jgi:cytochrome c oxidase subunit 1
MLFCIGFVSLFIIGGVTGVFLASIPVDLVLHDTYYVVGHFHFILMAILAAVFAGIYYWFPLYTGKWYQPKLAKIHFWLFMIGSNLTFFAMILLGYNGMPRRYATYNVDIGPVALFTDLHQIATVGAYLIGFSGLVFLWNIVQSWLEGPRVEENDPWDLAQDGLLTKEWEWFDPQQEMTLADGGSEAKPPQSDDDTEETT